MAGMTTTENYSSPTSNYSSPTPNYGSKAPNYGSKAPNCTREENGEGYHVVLLVIYSVVFLCGTVSLSLMMHILRSRAVSSTSSAVFNLIFGHFIFLFTVPFRIYYYANNSWGLHPNWCKIVSALIHVHMYMSFIFYVVILVTRLLPYYCRNARMASFSGLHALIGSTVMWIVVLVAAPLIICLEYGNNGQTHNNTKCFDFAKSMNSAKELNYILSTLIIVVAVVLTGLQANVLWGLYRKFHKRSIYEQEFGAQLKSLLFALIMVVCYIPYHIFRLYYIEHCELENINEVLLSLTTFNCLDMLTFLGRRTFNICFPGTGC